MAISLAPILATDHARRRRRWNACRDTSGLQRLPLCTAADSRQRPAWTNAPVAPAGIHVLCHHHHRLRCRCLRALTFAFEFLSALRALGGSFSWSPWWTDEP